MDFCFFLSKCYADHRDLHVLTHSFPTRRSSDLAGHSDSSRDARNWRACRRRQMSMGKVLTSGRCGANGCGVDAATLMGNGGRSEEHTSELQSLMRISYAVFCLKKKNN